MDYQVITVGGWKSRKLDWVPFYKCPDCGDRVDFLFESGGMAKCFGCQKVFPEHAFIEMKRKRTVVTCVCGRDVSLTPCNRGALGYICSECSNYVAICYGNQILQPSEILSFGWNPTICGRGGPVTPDGKLIFTRSKTAKDFLVLQVLQAIVKQEDARFLFGDPKEYRAGLLLDSERRKYLGYIAWTERKYAVLRQMFIVRDERRKGYAAQMVRYWVERYADKLHERFGIESPNDAAMRLHIKLGHARAEGDRYVGIKCGQVPSF